MKTLIFTIALLGFQFANSACYVGHAEIGKEKYEIQIVLEDKLSDRYPDDVDIAAGVFIYQLIPSMVFGKSRCSSNVNMAGLWTIQACNGLILSFDYNDSTPQLLWNQNFQGLVFDTYQRYGSTNGGIRVPPVGTFSLRPANCPRE